MLTCISCDIFSEQPYIPLSAHQWRPVQQKAKNTVVQLFVLKFERDIIEPYIMPAQRKSFGSGFFIQFEGQLYIVTNAHVVDQAVDIRIGIPSFGGYKIKVELVSICHDRDIALLKIADDEIDGVRAKLGGSIPFLTLGNADELCRADEVLAFGYPLGQESLKITAGVFCGQQKIENAPEKFLQIDAPINPGSSGGPLLNIEGKVVGINSAAIPSGQNLGYSIPIDRLKIILPQMVLNSLVKKPSLGIVSSHASHLAELLGNPLPGGAYLSEVLENSPLDKAGIKKGDMLYQINGYPIDVWGDITVPWSEDRLSVIDYISSIGLDDDIYVVVYRKGKRIERTVRFEADFDIGIKRLYPGYEEIDYEVFAGMVIMPLSLNHIEGFGQYAPGLREYGNLKNQRDAVLVVTHVFPTSNLFHTRTISPGVILNHVNDIKVNTLRDLRTAIEKTAQQEFLTIQASDTISGLTDNLYVALRVNEVLKQEALLAAQYRYNVSSTVKELLHTAHV